MSKCLFSDLALSAEIMIHLFKANSGSRVEFLDEFQLKIVLTLSGDYILFDNIKSRIIMFILCPGQEHDTNSQV